MLKMNFEVISSNAWISLVTSLPSGHPAKTRKPPVTGNPLPPQTLKSLKSDLHLFTFHLSYAGAQKQHLQDPTIRRIQVQWFPIFKTVFAQLLSRVRLFMNPWTAAHQASLSFTISWSLLKLMSIESVMPSNHLICHSLLPLPSIFPSIRVFSSELAVCIRCPKYQSFNFSISPSNEYLGLVSFRMDWFDLLLSKGLSFFFLILFYF